MKNKSYLLAFSIQLSFWLWSTTMLTVALPAQELEQLISSKFEVIDEQDHQWLDCNTYRFGDEVLYDNPNMVRLYENGAYRFDFQFTYFGENGIITPNNYLEQFYSVQIPTSTEENYRITAISPAGDKLSIYAIATGEVGIKDTFRIQLLDDRAALLADAIYPFEVRADDPDAVGTTYLPMKIEYRPIFVNLEDADNPNNRIERQLLPFAPDTINVDAKKAFNLLTEIEQEVQIGGQSYVLVADHEDNYGYQVSYGWEGPGLKYKPGSKNGLKAYLTTVPGRTPSTTRPTLNLKELMVADLKKAGLDQAGKRVQQEFVFEQPNTQLKKVYQLNYAKKNPNVIRKRVDPKTTQHLLQKNLPKIQLNLKEANQQVLQYYKVAPKQKVQPQKATIASANKASTRRSQKISREKVQPTKRNKGTVRDHRKPAAKNEKVRVTRPTPNYPVKRVPPTPLTDKNYYTLAIKVSRNTEVMSHQTYFLTLRLIE